MNLRTLLLVALCTIGLGAAPSLTAQSQADATPKLTPQQVAKRAFPSVIMVSVNDKQGQPLSIGSGFIHSPGVAVTNLHVIDEGGSATIRVVGRKESMRVTGVLRLDERNDLALLAFDNKAIPALALASGTPEIGDEVYAIGNPRGLEGTFSPGIVSGIRQFEADSLLQITAPISRGSSGGPVLNNRGEVVGVAVSAIRDGQNLNFAVPASAIRAAAAKLGEAKPIARALGELKKETKSVIKASGGELASGVKVHAFDWDTEFDLNGAFTVSVKNQLDVSIRDMAVQVIFYGVDGEPIESQVLKSKGDLEPGLARRISGEVDKSVKRLTTRKRGTSYPVCYESAPHTKVEYRVLTFDFAQ